MDTWSLLGSNVCSEWTQWGERAGDTRWRRVEAVYNAEIKGSHKDFVGGWGRVRGRNIADENYNKFCLKCNLAQ